MARIGQAGDGGNNTLTGTAGDDILAGLAGDDLLYGLAGDDVLDGGTGDDWMEGGAGNDIYYVDSNLDVVVELPAEGWDIIRASVSSTLPDDVEVLILTGTAFDATGNGEANFLYGNDVGNGLFGFRGDDKLYGRGGDDLLQGGEGDDILDGGAGDDSMEGGDGDDLFYVDSTSDEVIENAGEGYDTVRSTASFFTVPDNVERLILVGSALFGIGNADGNEIVGSDGNNTLNGLGGDDRLFGRGGDDNLNGGEGNDWLDGGSGTNTLIGGNGDDTYLIADGSTNTVVETTGGGFDTVRTDVDDYTLPDNVEALTLLGNAFTGNGNAGDNTITGTNDDNDLYGGGGNDRILGRYGDDWLFGEDGNDVLLGGDGYDELYGGDGDDVLVGDEGDDWLDGGLGIDQLRGGGGDDSFLFHNDTSIGDMFDGGDGMDTLVLGYLPGTSGCGCGGGGGVVDNTTYDLTSGRFRSIDSVAIDGAGNTVLIGDAITRTANFTGGVTGQLLVQVGPGATDTTIDASAVRPGQGMVLVFSFGPGDVTFTGSANTDATVLADGDDTAHGGGGDDLLGGGAGDDTLYGDAGNDSILGGDGDDVMWGGAGSDAFGFTSGETGHDQIMDFEQGDLIDAYQLNYTSIADFASIDVVGSNTVITIDPDTTITLVGYTGVTASDFIFV